MMPLSQVEALRDYHLDMASKAAFEYCAALNSDNPSVCDMSMRRFLDHYRKCEVLNEVLR